MRKLLLIMLLSFVLQAQTTSYSLDFTAANSEKTTLASSSAWNFGTSDIVVFVRVKLKSTNVTHNVMSKYQTTINRWYINYFHTTNRIALVREVNDDEDVLTLESSGVDTDWHSWMFYVDYSSGSSSDIYLDGVDKTPTANTFGNNINGDNTGTFTLGTQNVSYASCYISKVAIWKGTFTAAQVAAAAPVLHNDGDDGLNFLVDSGNYNFSSSLAAYYEINEGSGQTLEDLVGSEDITLGDDGTVEADDPTWSTTAPPYTRVVATEISDILKEFNWFGWK